MTFIDDDDKGYRNPVESPHYKCDSFIKIIKFENPEQKAFVYYVLNLKRRVYYDTIRKLYGRIENKKESSKYRKSLNKEDVFNWHLTILGLERRAL